MPRVIAHFSCGAASAVATKLSRPSEIWYIDTGSEDIDNYRFLRDCERWFGQKIHILKSDTWEDTWDVWEKKKYLSNRYGAPCTRELKIAVREQHQKPDDVHVLGYTADKMDRKRVDSFREHYPDLQASFPLVDKGITKEACLGILGNAGINPPRVYAMGYPHANCIPCVKATSPGYWALVRKHHPEQFRRMAELEKRLGAKLARFKGIRIQLEQLPEDIVTTDPIAPACDFLCHLAEQDIAAQDLI